MGFISKEILAGYWSTAEITTNLIIFMNLLGALCLGLLVEYERSYHGFTPLSAWHPPRLPLLPVILIIGLEGNQQLLLAQIQPE